MLSFSSISIRTLIRQRGHQVPGWLTAPVPGTHTLVVEMGVPDIWVINIPSPTELIGRWRRFLSCWGELEGPGRFIETGGWDNLAASWDIGRLGEGLGVAGIIEYGSVDDDGIVKGIWLKMSSPEDDIDVDTMVFVDNKDDKLETEEDMRMLDVEASFEAEVIRPSEPIAEYEMDIKTKTFSTKRKTFLIFFLIHLFSSWHEYFIIVQNVLLKAEIK